VKALAKQNKKAYPELYSNASKIEKVLEKEEGRLFNRLTSAWVYGRGFKSTRDNEIDGKQYLSFMIPTVASD
jgi:alanyl-tRNA synthetase